MQKIIKHSPEFFRFALVGACTAGVFFGLFALFYNTLGIVYYISQTIAFIGSVLFQYLANRLFTFKLHHKIPHSHFVKYLLVLLLNYLVIISITCIAVEYLKYSPYIGILLSVGVTVFLSFGLNRFWVFKKYH